MTPAERLQSIFAGVNDWLKHAEAKNGVLVAANGAALLALLGAGLQHQIVYRWQQFYFFELALLLFLGLVTALSAFLPVIRARAPEAGRPFPGTGNLLYFGDVAGSDPSSYLNALCETCGDAAGPPGRYERDLASQIVINSEIGLAKYRRFTMALRLTLAGLLTPPVAFLYVAVRWTARWVWRHLRAWRQRRSAVAAPTVTAPTPAVPSTRPEASAVSTTPGIPVGATPVQANGRPIARSPARPQHDEREPSVSNDRAGD